MPKDCDTGPFPWFLKLRPHVFPPHHPSCLMVWTSAFSMGRYPGAAPLLSSFFPSPTSVALTGSCTCQCPWTVSTRILCFTGKEERGNRQGRGSGGVRRFGSYQAAQPTPLWFSTAREHGPPRNTGCVHLATAQPRADCLPPLSGNTGWEEGTWMMLSPASDTSQS